MAAQRTHADSNAAHPCWFATVRRHFLKAIDLALPVSPPKLAPRLHEAAAQLECGAAVSDPVLWSAYQAAYRSSLASYVPPACAGPEHHACPHRTLSAYLSWFWGGKFRKQPAYLADEGLSGKVVAAMLRFRTLNCDLPVHTLLDVPFAARSCDCGCGTDQLAMVDNNKTVFTVHFRPSNGPETARQVRGGRGEQPPRNLGSNHQRQAGRRPETSEVKGRTGTPDAGGANDKHRKPAHQKSVA